MNRLSNRRVHWDNADGRVGFALASSSSTYFFRSRLRLFLSVFLVLFLSLNDLGFMIYTEIYRHFLKQEVSEKIRTGIDCKSLEAITVPNDSNVHGDFVWTEQNKEFSYRGRMYDIVSSNTATDSTTYYCIEDSRETILQGTVEQHFNRNRTGTVLIRGNFTLPAFLPDSRNCGEPFAQDCRYGSQPVHEYPEPNLELVTPPPKARPS